MNSHSPPSNATHSSDIQTRAQEPTRASGLSVNQLSIRLYTQALRLSRKQELGERNTLSDKTISAGLVGPDDENMTITGTIAPSQHDQKGVDYSTDSLVRLWM